MPDSFQQAINNTIEQLERLADDGDAFLLKRDLPEHLARNARLAVEEMVSNIIKYGYDDRGEHRIDVAMRVENDRLTLEIVDDGHPFNPLSVAPPDFGRELEDRPIGGLGIHLVRNLAAAMSYRRTDGKNMLFIVFRIEKSSN